VFAKELAMPGDWRQGWEVIRKNRETQIDLPMVEFSIAGKTERRYFAQLAGTGLDARAIELADWELKKKLGAWAYIWAALKAMSEQPASVTFSDGKDTATGALVLIGNGQFYGGKYRLHPAAKLRDGLLHVCVFAKVNWLMLIRCAGVFLAGQPLPKGMARVFQSKKFTLTSPSPAPFEVDGENIGHLPATFSIAPEKLRVIAP
jgi:diacylglycerol kinase family enzyme